ncbi:helix-turn-helix domain-containing protein [Limosilactobacillus reuteri]|uniref:helix-turn-helix domain-containing protein n=1 Tax=Limosilactobacillus reuteri TaxID=1598 RepID=UPI00081BEC9B|nr:helix-turn-helix transcriptional regulator [Limosilactobacillus reuteri]MCH5379667.1 helix-turn-helix transcriptional regulator [Limosilactobacillus reuteri]MCT3208768.1 XRE family transcriptional regulator [Limosilactobacillus reuteri]MCT3217303.1 XRE family transcriptional regulator [Limosilactobacillus reuteri]OCW61804.1 transcriptional regulator [Limosilactobacillus reuteri]OCW62317.1 transcriptional regulator [Limosilactobacillus reuteri]
MNNLGANIRARRHELGITQEQLSNNTGLSINYISRLEVGTANNVSAKTLSHIAEVLKTSMDKLMHGSTDETEMGFYQKKLWQALNEMDEKQAEQVSKNVLGLINLNKE